MATTLLIADTAVQQDAGGRFSLNDLHRASGSDPKHRPGEFLRNKQTQDLIAELSTAEIPAVETTEGNGGGTFVARELVYSYAMWISARFHLQVIRAYDAMVTAGAVPAGLTVPHVLAAQRQAQRLVQAIADAKSQAVQQLLHGHLVATQRMLGEAAPALAVLLAGAPPANPGQGTLPGIDGAST